MILLSNSYLLISLQHGAILDDWYRFEHDSLNAFPLPRLTYVWMPGGSNGGNGRTLPLHTRGDEDYQRDQCYNNSD